MLKKMLIGYVLVVPVLLPHFAEAEVETRQLQTMQLAAAPLDTTVSADGKLVFVLTDKMEVEIYDAGGRHKDSIKLNGNFDRIATSPSGDKLFLTDAASKKVNVLEVSFVQGIDIKDSPFKGPVDAPVVIALFSDYQ
jgi:hypothetical protein